MKEKKYREFHLLKYGDYENELTILQKMKIPYTLTVSNYTVSIETKTQKFVYVKKEQSKQMFAAYAKIKSDIKNIVPPDIDKFSLKYFHFDRLRDDANFSVWNIDIKSAYATALFNAEFISKKTFYYLSCLEKQDRLSCVGMLASRKIKFDHDKDGNIISKETIISPYENFFWFAVQKTFFAMMDAREIAGNDYLFSWVDSIYFRPSKNAKIDIPFLIWDRHKMKTSFTEYQFCNVIEKEKNFYLSLEKTGEAKKIFNLPKHENFITSFLSSYLKNKFHTKKQTKDVIIKKSHR